MNFKVYKKLKLGGAPLALTPAEKLLAIIDNNYVLYFLDAERLGVVKTQKLTKNHEPHFPYYRGIAGAGGHIHLALGKTPKSILLQMEKGLSKKGSMEWHEAPVESAAVSPCGKYLATGGQDGKVYVFDLATTNLLTSLEGRPDYISRLTFSDDGTLLASSAFDKTTDLFNLETNEPLHRFVSPDVVEGGAFLEDNRHYYAVDRQGHSILFGMEEGKVLSCEPHFREWTTGVALTEDRRFAAVTTRSGRLFLVRLPENKVVADFQVDKTGISLLAFYKRYLFTATIDGHLTIFDTCSGEEELEIELKVKNYQKARGIVEQNVFLSFHPLGDLFRQGWEEELPRVKHLIGKEKIHEANAVAAPFLPDPFCKEEYDFLLSQKATAVEFLDFVEAKKFADAYKLAEAYPYLTGLEAYREMEEYWKKVFIAAKKLIEADPRSNRKRCEELFKPFVPIPKKKEQITNLLYNAQVFGQAEQAVRGKQFKAYFQLTQKYPFLTESDLYQKVLNLVQRIFEQIALLEQQRKFAEAAVFAKRLLEFPPFREKAAATIALLEEKQAFADAVDAGDQEKAYAILEKHPEFLYSDTFLKLNQVFQEAVDQATKYAFIGDAPRAERLLAFYEAIPFRREKVASVMKIAYLNEIKGAAVKAMENTNWRLLFLRYIQLFSKDPELAALCRQTGLEKELEEVAEKGDKEGYKRLELPSSILA